MWKVLSASAWIVPRSHTHCSGRRGPLDYRRVKGSCQLTRGRNRCTRSFPLPPFVSLSDTHAHKRMRDHIVHTRVHTQAHTCTRHTRTHVRTHTCMCAHPRPADPVIQGQSRTILSLDLPYEIPGRVFFCLLPASCWTAHVITAQWGHQEHPLTAQFTPKDTSPRREL